MVDYGVNLEAKRQQLLTCLQDYMENVMWPRMNREGSADHVPAVTAEEERREPAPVRSIGRERRSNNNNRRGAGADCCQQGETGGQVQGQLASGPESGPEAHAWGIVKGVYFINPENQLHRIN